MHHNNPLAEVFGWPRDCMSNTAHRFRSEKLCPFFNKVPNCTKDSIDDPIGTCSIWDGDVLTITCPVRFRENWMIAKDAADFLFPGCADWDYLSEARMKQANGIAAGNVDLTIVKHDAKGQIVDFGIVEVQSVYISGNISNPLDYYMADPANRHDMNWRGQPKYPSADFLSSSRKRLVPQLVMKGGIANAWKKKIAVVLQEPFFNTLPHLEEVPQDEADLAWLLYDLRYDATNNCFALYKTRTVYTEFAPSILRLANPVVGDIAQFQQVLQTKLNAKLAARKRRIQKDAEGTGQLPLTPCC